MNKYAILQKPSRKFKNLEIEFVFSDSYLKAIDTFKRGKFFNAKNIYTIYNVDEVDNHYCFYEITLF